MPQPASLTYFLEDTLRGDSRINARAMFGGYGLYYEGKIFGIFDDDLFFFKVDAESKPEYEARGSRPFSYPKKDGTIATMPKYWLVPDEIIEDPNTVLEWISKAAYVNQKA